MSPVVSASSGTPRYPEPDGRPTWLVVAVLCLSGTVVALQQTLVVPLLPEYPHILGTSADNVAWLVTATLLVGAVATPTVSRLADMVGKRRMLLLCLVVTIAGSLLAAIGQTLLAVVVGRGLQGFGIALIPVGISILRDTLPPDRVASGVALMSSTLGIGAAVGLPTAGLLAESLGWQSLFWGSALTATLLLVGVLLVVPESEIKIRGRFDLVGAIVLSVGLAALLLAITKGGRWGWGSTAILGLVAGAVVVLALWVPYELHVGNPLVDLRTFARRQVLLTNLAALLLGFAMYANMLITTQQLQLPVGTGHGFGTSVTVAGLCMLPGGLSMVLLAPVSARLTRRHGARTTLIAGALVIALGYLARLVLIHTIWQIVVGAAVVSAGTAIAYAALPTLIMRAVPITETASANGLNTLLRAVGTSSSSAVVAAILTSLVEPYGDTLVPTLGAFQTVFVPALVAALLAAGVAMAIARRGSEPGGVGEAELRGSTRPEMVVRGTVRAPDDGRPLRHAVVTALDGEGREVDWARADNAGGYSVVLPGPGRYVVVAAAEGFAPRSVIREIEGAASDQHLQLGNRLTLHGRVTLDGRPLPHVVVSVTRATGEHFRSVRADADGYYELPQPRSGRYVLTVVDPDLGWARSLQLLLLAARSNTVDVDVASTGGLSVAAPSGSRRVRDREESHEAVTSRPHPPER